MPFTLQAEDLLDKYGFGDGEMLDDFLEDAGFDPTAQEIGDDDLAPYFGPAVVAECVRRHLAPLLIGYDISYAVSVAHNPVRIAPSGHDDRLLRETLAGLSATVTEEQVMAAAGDLAPRYDGARPQGLLR